MKLVFTAYQRPRYFDLVLDQWQKVRGFADSDPTVYLEPSSEQVLMTQLATTAGCKVHQNLTRQGVLTNPWNALDAAFDKGHEFVVLAEDDVLVSTDTLEYFAWAAAYFRLDKVLTVCAASFHEEAQESEQYQAVRHKGQFTPLIWGTWRDRWRHRLRDTWDHNYSTGTPSQPQSGWDWNINLRVMGDWDVVSPYASRSTHIGEHGGQHTTPQSYPASVSKTFRRHRDPGQYSLR